MKTKHEGPINRAISAIALSKDINSKNIAYKQKEHRGVRCLKSALFLLLFFSLIISYTIPSAAASYSLALSEIEATKLSGKSPMLPTGDIDKSDSAKNQVTIKVVSEEKFSKLTETSVAPRVRNAIRTSDYYYSQLNDSDKMYYKAYLEAARANVGAVADLNEENASTYGTLVYSGSSIIDYPDWHSLGAAIEFDHPEELESILYKVKLSIFASIIGGELKYNYYLYFAPGSDYTGDQVAAMEDELLSACNSFYNGLDLSGDDFSKELTIHDAIIEAMDYNYDVLNSNLVHDEAHTAYGAFVNKAPVCDGYAKAFKMLLNKAGIESHIIAGLGNGGGHAWNIVKIGDDFYECDLTWDDQKYVSGYPYNYLVKHDYFNRTTEDFEKHSPQAPGYSGNTSHERDERFLGYLEPEIAYGTEKSYKNEKQIYELTFDGVASDASFVLPYGRICTYEGKIVELPVAVRRNGYVFDGWYDSATGGSAVTKDTSFSKASTLYARWTADNYKVVFNAAGGTFGAGKTTTETVAEIGTVLTLSDIQAPSREGYEFAGWSKTENSDTALTEYKVLQDATFYAVWTKKEVQNTETEPVTDTQNTDTNKNEGSDSTDKSQDNVEDSGEKTQTGENNSSEGITDTSNDSSEGTDNTENTSVEREQNSEDDSKASQTENDEYKGSESEENTKSQENEPAVVEESADDESSEKSQNSGDKTSNDTQGADNEVSNEVPSTDSEASNEASSADSEASNEAPSTGSEIVNETQNTDNSASGESQNAENPEPGESHNIEDSEPSESQKAEDSEPSESQNTEDSEPSESQKAEDSEPSESQNTEDPEPGESQNPDSDEGEEEQPVSEADNEEALQITETGIGIVTGDDSENDSNNNTSQSPTTIQTVPVVIIPDQESSDTNKLVTALVNVSDSGKAYVVSPSGTASVGKAANKSITTVSIGKSVTYNGVSYNVTEIAKNAYKNCKKLSSLTIGANVESIGAKAFSGCKNLKKVTINGNNLKSVGKGSFKGIKSGAKIIIICKDKKTYNKLVKKLKKAGAQEANFKFKKG